MSAFGGKANLMRMSRLYPLRSYIRKANGSFKAVVAGLALPKVPRAALVDVFRPFRQEQALSALRAFHNLERGYVFCRVIGHRAFLLARFASHRLRGARRFTLLSKLHAATRVMP